MGEPEYQFVRVRNNELAESAFYNEVVSRIQKDLMILYENTFAVHNELTSKFNWFEVEKNRLEYEAKKLETEVREKSYCMVRPAIYLVYLIHLTT
ncbi:hypothetical protein AAAC51_07475 [Priestia megaterium]